MAPTATLIGRVPEQREIDAALVRAASGAGGLVLVAGEAGMGKTALARHGVMQARERGFAVAWAGCWQTAAVPPLLPWTEVLAQLADDSGATVPDLAVSATDRDAARVEQSRRVASWLRQRGPAPTLLVLDDLHWADAGTLSVLTHVASLLATMPVVVIGAHRSARSVAGSSFAAELDTLRHHASVLELPGLDPHATAALVTAVTGRPTDDATGRTIARITGGNPLFTRELSRTLSPDALDQTLDPADVPVPPSVQSTVADRLATLGEACRQVLAATSVAGDEVPTDLLGVVTGLDGAALLDAVDEATSAGLVEGGPAAVAFVHSLFRAAVHESLSSATRVDLHHRIGEELLARRDRGLPVDVAALAHHFGRSAPRGNAGRAFGFAVDAARDAARLLSFDLAARRYQQALAMLALDPGLGDRRALLLDLADAQAASGDPQARATWLTVAEDARQNGDARSLGLAALGLSGATGGIEVRIGDLELCRLLEEATALLPDDVPLRARLEGRLSVALSYRTSVDERAAIADRASDRARRSGDPVAVAETLAAWCDVVAGPDHLDSRRDAAREIVEGAATAGDAALEALGRRLLVEALFESGDLRAAEAEVGRYARAATRIGRADYAWYPALWRASLALARAQPDAWLRARAELDDLAGDLPGTNAALLAAVQLGSMAFDLADPVLADRSLGQILDDHTVDDVQMAISVGTMQSLAGDLEGARRTIDANAEAALAAPKDSEWTPMVVQLAEIVDVIGGHPIAEDVYAALAPYGAVWSVEGIGAGLRGPVDRVLGSLAARRGDPDAAEAHFAAARRATTAAGAHLLTALVDHAAGRALGHRERLDRAAATWRRLGATYRLAQAGVPDGADDRTRPAPPDDNTMVREGDVWSITFQGVTSAFRDRKGLRDLARLLADPRREIAALDLVAEGPTLAEADTGARIDHRAREEYRARLVELEAELDEADDHGDVERSSRLVAERDLLLGELAGAYGLGGRARRDGGSAERARTTVRSRIRDALRHVEEADPALARHLHHSVRTGTFCSYDPEPPVRWVVDDGSHTV